MSCVDAKFEMLKDETGGIKESISDIVSLTKDSEIPLGLKKILQDTFSCFICHGSLKPPTIATKCCKTILGCEACVNVWYSGTEALTKTCPNC